MYDIVLQNGRIVDGSRGSSYRGSVAILDEKIAKIGTEAYEGKQVIDCSGKVIAPGFIDLHTHSDATPLNKGKNQSMVHQGITSQLTGNCGISLMPANDKVRKEVYAFFDRTIEIPLEDKSLKINNLEAYIQQVGSKKLSTNLGLLVGHGTLRAAVIGFDDRDATQEELEEMKNLLRKELEAGAFGMSLGLIYPPSSYGSTKELIELSKVLKEYNAILTVHKRNEGEQIFESMDEMIQVAEGSGVHLHISHLKLMGKNQWGKAHLLLEKIKGAKEAGLTITCDQYPYTASSTGLSALVPSWAHDGGNAEMLKRIAQGEPKLVADILAEMNRRGGAKAVEVSSTHGHRPEDDGKTIAELAEKYSLTPEQTVAKVLLEAEGEVSAIYYSMNQEDLLNIMKELFISVGSDGYDFPYGMGYNPHPRSFGTFPRFLQLVREHQLMPMEDAVYKITALPASIMKLLDRGLIKEGYIADVTVFDAEKVKDNATFSYSPVPPTGISYVLINGAIVIAEEVETGVKAGGLLLQTI